MVERLSVTQAVCPSRQHELTNNRADLVERLMLTQQCVHLDSELTNNRADWSGGAIVVDSAVCPSPTAQLTNNRADLVERFMFAQVVVCPSPTVS